MTRKDVVYIACILVLACGLVAVHLRHKANVQALWDGSLQTAHHVDHLYAKTGIPPAEPLTDHEMREITSALRAVQAATP